MKAGAGLLAAVLAALPAAATADPSWGTAGITLNPIAGGYHESYDDIVHLPPVPVPFLEGNYHAGNFEVALFGLPPTIAIPYTDAIQGQTALRLTILDATFRVFSTNGRFGIGAGEAIYNQTTHYAVADSYATSGDMQQYSRIVGATYEVISRLPLAHGTLEANLRYAPVMLGTQVSTYGDGTTPTRYDPERAEQIDGEVRYLQRAGRDGLAVLGLRYVNFTAVYDTPLRPLSDRNCALLPSIGYLWRFGGK